MNEFWQTVKRIQNQTEFCGVDCIYGLDWRSLLNTKYITSITVERVFKDAHKVTDGLHCVILIGIAFIRILHSQGPIYVLLFELILN